MVLSACVEWAVIHWPMPPAIHIFPVVVWKPVKIFVIHCILDVGIRLTPLVYALQSFFCDVPGNILP